MRNISFDKSYTKCDEECDEQISGSIIYSFIQFAFIASQLESSQNILKLSCRELAFTSKYALFKNE